MGYNRAARSSRVHAQWLAQPEQASWSAGRILDTVPQGTKVLAAVHTPLLRGWQQPVTMTESPIDRTSPFQLKQESTRTVSQDLEEGAWPKPLQTTLTAEEEPLLAQQLWRSFGAGSSLYSRPSSWGSVSTTDKRGAEGLERGLGAGPGPILYSEAEVLHRCSFLPAVCTLSKQRRLSYTVNIDRI